jgi:DNA-binding transcriptional LysR family regulator
MDRLDAMRALVLAVEEGSLAAAARRLRHSPAAMTRALDALERRLGTRLLHRTTRALRPTAAGERYIASCRQVLAELDAAERATSGAAAEPRGLLTLTSPATFGRLHVRPIVDDFLAANPGIRVRLLLLDRVVDLVQEGVDAAVRIGPLPDSSLTGVRLGHVRRVVCASPGYLARAKRLRRPQDLADHEAIVFSQNAGEEVWSFTGPGAGGRRRVRLEPRLNVNDALAAVASAAEGRGVIRVLSYQAEGDLAAGRLVRLLKEFEPAPLPVHLLMPQARPMAARLRAFADFAVPALRAKLAAIDKAMRAARDKEQRG